MAADVTVPSRTCRSGQRWAASARIWLRPPPGPGTRGLCTLNHRTGRPAACCMDQSTSPGSGRRTAGGHRWCTRPMTQVDAARKAASSAAVRTARSSTASRRRSRTSGPARSSLVALDRRRARGTGSRGPGCPRTASNSESPIPNTPGPAATPPAAGSFGRDAAMVPLRTVRTAIADRAVSSRARGRGPPRRRRAARARQSCRRAIERGSWTKPISPASGRCSPDRLLGPAT